MAAAVEFREFTPIDSRRDLIRRIDQAPVEHAEAVLAAYDVLQCLHESGALALLRGLLSARKTVTSHVVDVVSSKEAVTGLRIALMFGTLLSWISMIRRNCTVDPLSLSLSKNSHALTLYRHI